MERLMFVVRRTLNWVATIVALIIIIALPVGYFISGYEAEESAVQTEADINAYIITQLVNENPEMWYFEEMRLTELLSQRPRQGHPETRRIVDIKGRLIASSLDPLPTPIITRSAPLLDSGVTVGWILIGRSLRSLLMRTAVVGLVGLILGLIVFFPLRLLPQHAMERMLREMREITEHKLAEERLAKLNHLKGQLLIPGSLDEKLKRVTDGVVGTFDADFARIWTVDKGDLCERGCIHAAVTEGPHVCRDRSCCLHLIASSGRYTHIDGNHRRVPLGAYKIGLVATGEDFKFITNDVTHDPLVHNHEWAEELGLVSFAGFSLRSPDGSPIGVLALFSKHAIGPDDESLLENLASTTSYVILTDKVENLLRESDERFRQITENAMEWVWEVDSHGLYTYSSSVVEKLLGYTPEEIVGKKYFFDFMHPDDREECKAGTFQAFAEKKPLYEFVNRNVHRDGRDVWLSTTGMPILDEAGNLKGYRGIGSDITERKRAEEERDMSMARLEALWNLAQMQESDESELYEVTLVGSVNLTGSKYGLIARTSEDGRILRLKFLTPEASRDCRIPDEYALETDRLPILGRTVREKTYVIDNECKASVEHRLPSGHVAIERILAVPILGEGIVQEVIAVANKPSDYNEQDANQLLLMGAGAASIIERRAFEEKIKELTRTLERRVVERTAQLEEVNRELEAFTYSVSHDLRSPLRSIDGFSLAIVEDYSDKLDDTGRDYLGRVRAATQRMGHLIDDLLRLSRVTRAEMQYADVNLSNLVREILSELQNSAPERKVELVVQPDVVVRGDAELLRIALGNLLDNAWKFTGKKLVGIIEFGCVGPKNKRVCFVRDNGVGFDSQYADKLFQPFQRLHAESDFPGTGIGLAIVKRIIGRHGGRVWAEGDVDQGTAFYFTLMRPKGKR